MADDRGLGMPADANPWLGGDQWNVTKQGEFVRRFGVAAARARAKEAGVELGATKPAEVQPTKIVERRSYIFQKRVSDGGARGYDGDMPPGET